MTEIYLVRHGEAEGNVFRRIHGIYDSLLTPRGHRQVECVEKRFENIPIDAVYSSDLVRTSLTSRGIYVPKGLELRRDPHFREVDLGIWEDVPFGWLDRFESVQMRNFNHDPLNWRVRGAETYDDYTTRFLDGMTKAAREHEGGNIAIFAHGAVIRGVLMRLFFNNQLGKLPYSDNTGVCKLIWNDGAFSYEFLNDNSHLPQELSTFALQFWWRRNDNRRDVNLYFLPYEPSHNIAHPDLDSRGFTLTAMLHDNPIGVVSMAAPEEGRGTVIGMTLLEELDGKLYGDQLLGTAFSHFRRLGCRELRMNPGWYPDNLLDRYEFDPVTGCRSIATDVFDWS